MLPGLRFEIIHLITKQGTKVYIYIIFHNMRQARNVNIQMSLAKSLGIPDEEGGLFELLTCWLKEHKRRDPLLFHGSGAIVGLRVR